MLNRFIEKETERNTVLVTEESPYSTTPGSNIDPLTISSIVVDGLTPSIVPDQATPSSSPIEAWTIGLSRNTPKTATREILPDTQTPIASDSPIGEDPTPTPRYYSKKLHRSVTVSRGSKKKKENSQTKKQKTTKPISGDKQRLISAMLGIVPLGENTASENPVSQFSQLENESTRK